MWDGKEKKISGDERGKAGEWRDRRKEIRHGDERGGRENQRG